MTVETQTRLLASVAMLAFALPAVALAQSLPTARDQVAHPNGTLPGNPAWHLSRWRTGSSIR